MMMSPVLVRMQLMMLCTLSAAACHAPLLADSAALHVAACLTLLERAPGMRTAGYALHVLCCCL
jgi:hypothetical protein